MGEQSSVGDLVDLVRVKTAGPKSRTARYVGLEHIAPGGGLIGTASASVSSSVNGVFGPGDVLFGKLRPNLRKSVQVDFPGYCSTDLLILRAKAVHDPGFVAHAATTDSVFRHAEANAIGTRMPRTSWRAIADAPAWAPQRAEQRRIAEILDTLDETIAATECLIAKLSTTRVSLLAALLPISPVEARPSHWQVRPLQDLLASVEPAMRSGPFGSALLSSELVDEGVPLLGIDNVCVEGFRRHFTRFVAPEKARGLRRYAVRPNDLMITIMGTVGRCCLVPEDLGPALSSKHVWAITLDPQLYLPGLACLQINYSDPVRRQLLGGSQGGIMAAIRGETLRNLSLPVPPREEQDRIWAVLQRAMLQIRARECELDKLRSVRAGLADDLLTGRVRTVAV